MPLASPDTEVAPTQDRCWFLVPLLTCIWCLRFVYTFCNSQLFSVQEIQTLRYSLAYVYFKNGFVFWFFFGLFLRQSPPIQPFEGCLGTCSVDQTGLEPTNASASASLVLELKACHSTAWLQHGCFHFFLLRLNGLQLRMAHFPSLPQPLYSWMTDRPRAVGLDGVKQLCTKALADTCPVV